MADVEEKHRISVAGTAVQAAKHEMPLELYSTLKMYTPTAMLPPHLPGKPLLPNPRKLSKTAREGEPHQSLTPRTISTTVKATHIILRRHLPHEVIAHNREFLHYVSSDLGDLVEKEEGENASDRAEGCGGYAAVGGYVSDLGVKKFEGEGRESVEAHGGLLGRLGIASKLGILWGCGERYLEGGGGSVQFHRSPGANAVEVGLYSVAIGPPVESASVSTFLNPSSIKCCDLRRSMWGFVGLVVWFLCPWCNAVLSLDLRWDGGLVIGLLLKGERWEQSYHCEEYLRRVWEEGEVRRGEIL